MYTKPFLREVAEDLHGRLGDSIGTTAIVFNNKRPIVYLKKHLGEVYGRPFWSPSFFSVQTFFALSTEKSIADFHTRFFYLLDAYNTILKEDARTEVLEDDFLSMAEIILGDFDQIDYELGDPDQIFGYLKDVAEIENSFDYLTNEQKDFLKRFWSSVNTETKSRTRDRFIELWQRLPRLYRKFKATMAENGMISMAETYRALAEDMSADNFLDEFSCVIFIGFNALSRSEGVFFKRWQAKGKALFYFDGDQYYVNDNHQEAGRFLRTNSAQWGLANALGNWPNLLANEKKVHIYPVLGFTVQAKTLDRILKNCMPSKTAIVLADEALLLPVLQTVQQTNVNITMGFPLKQSLLFSFVNLWCQAHKTKEPSDLLVFYEHPYVKAWNNEYPEPWKMVKSTFGKEQNTGYFLIETLIEILQGIMVLKSDAGNLSHIENALFIRFIEVLNQLSEAIRMCRREAVSVGIMASFIQKLLAGISAPIEGDPLDGLQVMGMLESRCLDFENVIILGANEGHLPALSLSPTFIPDSIRRTFGLPILENQEALSAYLFYRLWQRSSAISIVYNANVDQTSGEPSRFLQQMVFESGLTFQYHFQDQKISAGTVTKPVVIEKTPAIMEILYQYLSPNNKRFFSASALNLYLECPLQFFLRYIAGIKPPDEGKGPMHPITIGRVVHTVMEAIYKEYERSGKPVEKLDLENMLASDLHTLCLGIMKEELKDTPPQLEQKSTLLIATHIVEENVKLILQYDKSIAPFYILELENHTDYKAQLPFEVAGSTRWANLSTIIDRVDRVQGKVRIVDYKTGSDKLGFKLDELGQSNIRHASKAGFQALFYTLIYEEVCKTKNVEPHLYVLRKIRDEGSLIYAEDILKDPGTSSEKLEAIKDLFRTRLQALLAELFNPDIPFQHNDASDTCVYKDYAQLCHPDGWQLLPE